MDSERDEASDDEIHDVALAVETSDYSPQGHEVTSRPSDDDQGETARIVTEAVEQSGLGRPAVRPPATMPEPSAPPRPAGAPSTTSRPNRRSDDNEDHATDGS